MSDWIQIRNTDSRKEQIAEIERLTGASGPSAIVDFALAYTLAGIKYQESDRVRVIESYEANFSIDDDGTWRLYGVNSEGNAWETDDFESDGLNNALDMAVDYLRSYHDAD